VIWERVGASRVAPEAVRAPPSSLLARIDDARAAQFWDPEQLTSAALHASARKAAGWKLEALPSARGVVWDSVLVFPPGARWGEALPAPSYSGGDVVSVIDELRKRL
jgi:hypothetical protein